MTTHFKLGAVPSPDDPKDAAYAFHESELLVGAMLPSTKEPSILGAHVWREQHFQDCVGMSTVMPIQDAAEVRGEPLPLLSPMFAYGMSRFLARAPGPGELLPDTGSSARLALKACMFYGVVPESEWAETDDNVGLVPPMDVWQTASLAKVASYHRIVAIDYADFRSQILDALRLAQEGKACAPMFCMPVHDNYFVIGKDVYTKLDGMLRGMHMQMIAGYRWAPDALEIPGTWGTGFGDAGLALISFECLYAIQREVWVARPDFSVLKVAS